MRVPIQFRSPAALFAASAALLAVIGALTFHSNWPPLSWRNTHFAMGDVGEELLQIAALFAGFALVYFFYPRLLRRDMNRALGWAHLAISLFAVFLQFALTSWFNLRFHNQPGESGFSNFMRSFGTSMDAFMWALGFFAFAQLIFLFNFFWSLFRKRKPGQQAANAGT